MVAHTTQKVYILGLTQSGRVFRPSDWAERLAGVMSSFRPGGAHRGSHFSYSPWCVPSTLNGTKCVIVSEALRHHNVMAWDFCMSFAKDNELQTIHGTPAKADNVVQLHPVGQSKGHTTAHPAQHNQHRIGLFAPAALVMAC